MFAQKQQVDKVNMSLDDIIKLNKKQNNQNNKTGNTSVQNNNSKRGGGQRKQRGAQNQGPKRSQQQTNRPRSKSVNNQIKQQQKPFGMMNKSKVIQKKTRLQQPKQQVGQRRPMQAQFVGNRRRRPNNNNRTNNNNKSKVTFNRFANGNSNKNAPVPSTITIIKPAPAQPNRSPSQKPGQPKWRRKAAGNATTANSKVLMVQSARKNVQKAKRLLIARKKPTTQLMTQHFASKLGIASKLGLARVRATKLQGQKPLQQPKKRSLVSQVKSKMLKVNVANKLNKVKAVQQRKSLIVKKQQVAKANMQASKRPILNRARPQGAPGITSSRMVFL